MAAIELEEMVPTPFGNGTVQDDGQRVCVTFDGPMAREAMEWALSSGKGERESWSDALSIAGEVV